MNGSESMSPAGSGSPTGPQKRKTEDGQPHQRAKRARYISLACNECKRRKIKCNGQTPCQRCGNLGLECLYAPNCCNSFKDSEEFKQILGQISSLQQQVDTLYSNLSALRNHVDTSLPPLDSPYGHAPYMRQPSVSSATTSGAHLSYPKPKHPKFHGPTSSAFSLGVAKSTLQTMGITGVEDGAENMGTTDGTPAPSPPPGSVVVVQNPALHASKDALWSVGKDEAIRLIHVWEDELACMYPVLDVDKLVQHTNLLYTFMEAARRTGLMEAGLPGADAIYDDQTRILKLVLATACTLEGSGTSELGGRLFESVRSSLEEQMFTSADIKTIRMLTLAATYHFHRDEESIAWRIAGFAARLCIELGLHRRETYDAIFSTETERAAATKLFWSIRVLDQRWSFGTGMPFALQDIDIDPFLQKPDGSCPYLSAMVQYSAIGSKVWQRVANCDITQTTMGSDEIDYLDYQVVQWHRSIPEPLKYIPPGVKDGGQPSSRTNHRLRILLYLRSNQMRTLIFRPVLHSAASISQNLEHALRAVDVAKDTIRILTILNQTTDLYRTQQVTFNYFLISALAVLFLAVSHAPEQFSSRCRDEFYMALDLVRGMQTNSYVSKRLWKTIKGLKEIGPKLGLNVRNPAAVDSAQDAHSTAAVAMAGLAGHAVDELALFGNGHTSLALGDSPNGMANDLTNLFEAVGGYSGLGGTPMNGYSGESMANGEGLSAVFGHQDEISRILKDLF